MLRVRPTYVLTLVLPAAAGCASDAASKSEVRTLQASVKQLQDDNLRLLSRVEALETERAAARAGQQPLAPILAPVPSSSLPPGVSLPMPDRPFPGPPFTPATRG